MTWEGQWIPCMLQNVVPLGLIWEDGERPEIHIQPQDITIVQPVWNSGTSSYMWLNAAPIQGQPVLSHLSCGHKNQMRQNIMPSGSSMAWNSVRRYLRHHNTSENSKSCSCWHEIFQVKQLTCLIWNPVPGKGFGWLSCQYICITWYCAEVKMQIKERHLSQSRWDKIMKFKTRER